MIECGVEGGEQFCLVVPEGRQVGEKGRGLSSCEKTCFMLVISSAVALVVCPIHPETCFAMKLEN